jgi:hypothetical protein
VSPGVRGQRPARTRTFNQNLIPPRLRKKLDEISKMQLQPGCHGPLPRRDGEVHVLHPARSTRPADVKIKGIWSSADQVGPIPDGFFQAACQQACPSKAISFGDILDPASQVSKERDSQRTYMMLGYLNTRPRTTYMMRVTQPQRGDPRVRPARPAGPRVPRRRARRHGDHGDSHGADAHGEAHSAAYIDGVKKYLDQGYSLSLKVLGATV